MNILLRPFAWLRQNDQPKAGLDPYLCMTARERADLPSWHEPATTEADSRRR